MHTTGGSYWDFKMIGDCTAISTLAVRGGKKTSEVKRKASWLCIIWGIY